jgi:hypothetical protein
MICDGDSNAYEAVKHTYVPVDDDEEEGNENEDEENVSPNEGKIRSKVTF